MTLEWVRLYRDERGSFAQLPLFTRAFAAELLKLTNDDGVIELGRREPADAVCFALGAEANERRAARRHMELLLADGYIVHDAENQRLVLPGFPRFQGRPEARPARTEAATSGPPASAQPASNVRPMRPRRASNETPTSAQTAPDELPTCAQPASNVRPGQAKCPETHDGTEAALNSVRVEKSREEKKIVEPPTSGGLAPAKAEAASVQQEIRKLEAGFDTELCADARAGCALTRRHGKLADSVWLNTLRALSAHPTPLVNEALRTFAARYADGEKDERYLLGIVRGLAKGKRGGPRGFSGGMLPESSEFGEAPAEEDLGTLFGGASA